MNYKQNLAQIKAIVLDVDGVLTDGSVLLSPDGSMSRTMNVKDGYAMQYALKKGLILAAITGGNDPQVTQRLQYLGMTDIYVKSHHKWEDFVDLKYKYDLKDEEVLYIGDDIPDLELIQKCGIGACPHDAVPEIRAIADYVSPFLGGKGVVRDLISQCLKVQGKWHSDDSIQSI